MTDKEKIRKEVERLRNLHQMKYQQLDADSSMSLVECGKRNLCNELLSFIDSLQSEEDDDDAWLNDIISKAECSLQLNKGEIDWLKSLKDRAQPQPRQELSEGDKRIIDNLISQLGNLYARKLIKEGTKDKYINWLKNLKDKVLPQPKQEWSEEDENIKESIIIGLEMLKDGASDKSLIALYNKKIDWLKSLKDRAQPQPRQEWSEEDENHVKSILSTIECCKAQFPNAQAVVEAYNADIEWLKSLRPQSQWRPSDEQMKALDIAIRCGIQLGTWEEDALKSLYQELTYKARDEHFKMF